MIKINSKKILKRLLGLLTFSIICFIMTYGFVSTARFEVAEGTSQPDPLTSGLWASLAPFVCIITFIIITHILKFLSWCFNW